MAQKSASNSTSQSSVMAQLMAKHAASFQTFKKGDLIKGRVTKLNKNEITVDINAKTEAIVLEKERSIMNSLLSILSVGDEVEVSILNPESDSGNPIVSLRRFLGAISWGKLEKAHDEESQIEVTITDMTKGGALASTETGLTGFLPNSHIAADAHLGPGKKVKVRVLDLDRKENKILFSQKTTLSVTDFEAAIKNFKDGDKVEATVTNITPFGMFATLPVTGKQTAEGKDMVLDSLIHISEMSWEKVEDINQLFTSGQKVEAVVIGFDKNARRVDLSVKRLTTDPFDAISEKYPVDKKVTGTIIKIDDSGAYVSLEEGVEAIIKKEKIPANVTYTEGQSVTATVAELDRKRHRVTLVPVLLEKPIGYR